MLDVPGIPNRLPAADASCDPGCRETVAVEMAELLAPYTDAQAVGEATRCLYCYDAPCMQACPTHIDIPGFIRKIATGNVRGSALTILDSNHLGATCARVCPVEELCQGACVLSPQDEAIRIGRLQRHATDWLAARELQPYSPGPATGTRVLVVGSGPAGLSTAAELAKLGHAVTIHEKRDIAGGLSTSGIIPLREPTSVALAEVEMVLALGVHLETSQPLATAEDLQAARQEYDAVVLATGLGRVPPLDVPGAEHILDGLEYIERAKLEGTVPAARHVVVVGAGNTAVDAATVARRSGAEATIVYRRGRAEMTAYDQEYEFVCGEGVTFAFLTQPVAVEAAGGRVTGLRCVRMRLGRPDGSGRPRPEPVEGSEHVLACDVVVRAIGQAGWTDGFGLDLDRGYFAVDDQLRTSVDRVWAGGDAIRVAGAASTVMAVQDGKKIAAAVHRTLIGA